MIGHIYRIQHVESNLCYVGSTFNGLKHRWQQHKSAYKKWNKRDGPCSAAIYHHIQKHGIDQFKCFIVKAYDVVDRAHLEAYESLWIRKLKACNRQQPFALSRKQQERSDYLKHREKRCSGVRAYAAKHKDVISQRKREYHLKNKDAIRAKKTSTYACECGVSCQMGGKARHFKSVKHKKWLEEQEM
jgi:hypothetical protein